MRLYSAFATVGGLSMVSRVLGFLRDILIAAILGTGMIADAFVVAFQGGEEGGVHAGREEFDAVEAEDINQEKIVRRKK